MRSLPAYYAINLPLLLYKALLQVDSGCIHTSMAKEVGKLYHVFGFLQEHFSKEVAECMAVGLLLVYPAFIGCGFYGEINPSGIHYVSVLVDGDMSSLAFGDFLQFFGEEELTVL